MNTWSPDLVSYPKSKMAQSSEQNPSSHQRVARSGITYVCGNTTIDANTNQNSYFRHAAYQSSKPVMFTASTDTESLQPINLLTETNMVLDANTDDCGYKFFNTTDPANSDRSYGSHSSASTDTNGDSINNCMDKSKLSTNADTGDTPLINALCNLSCCVSAGNNPEQQQQQQRLHSVMHSDTNTGTAAIKLESESTNGGTSTTLMTPTIKMESPRQVFREGPRSTIKLFRTKVITSKHHTVSYATDGTNALLNFVFLLLLVIDNQFKPTQVLQTCNFSPGTTSTWISY
jgi:hypothetical protein